MPKPIIKKFMVVKESYDGNLWFLADLTQKIFSNFLSDGILLTENSAKSIIKSLRKKSPDETFKTMRLG